ncbi:anti-sigma-K factor rskA [Chitinophaga skermanii]|uniref:Anti-sigma-K factor rskA n=1 Tax=Chitinophaga skermanii TaxID=331697 RepID=A0A327QFM0_9BACT|nr:anti-sigma factor [Chitinophaga skermanii]RAJ02574.1 anti-sigma-K factor rskA [Chitinophaga skermanii]
MDVNRYISSGIIESYVAGLTSEQESKEVQAYMLQFPEVKQAVDACQQDMERYVNMYAIQPPSVVKDRIFAVINKDENNVATDTVTVVADSPQARIYSIQEHQYEEDAPRPRNIWKYIAAAAIVGIIGCSAAIYKLYTDNQNINEKYQTLLAQGSTLQANNDVMQTKLTEMDEAMAIMRNPAMQKVKMPSAIKEHPEYLATVFFNPKEKAVYLSVDNMPEPPAGQQYQLWAIVKGQKDPVDAGVFDMGDASKSLQKMKAFGDDVVAFAVTLEKKGGSEKPTMPVYIAGKAS